MGIQERLLNLEAKVGELELELKLLNPKVENLEDLMMTKIEELNKQLTFNPTSDGIPQTLSSMLSAINTQLKQQSSFLSDETKLQDRALQIIREELNELKTAHRSYRVIKWFIAVVVVPIVIAITHVAPKFFDHRAPSNHSTPGNPAPSP